MRIDNAVTVNASPDEVFALVNDVERVAGCMPGATLDGRQGGDGHGGDGHGSHDGGGGVWSGRVKIKVGPVTAAYAGTVRFLEVDEEKRRLRVQARGADTHGSGDAEAEVALEVAEAPEGSELRLTTDLVIRGKIAQFGKGAVGAVSDRILQQFARNLGSLLEQERRAAAPSPSPVSSPVSTQVPAPASAAPPAAARHVPGGGPGAEQVPAPEGESGPAHGTSAAPYTPRPAAPAAVGDSELDGLSALLGPAVAKYAPIAGAFAFGLFEGWLLSRAFGGRRHRSCPSGPSAASVAAPAARRQR
ncbi:SRPBCC family protein [Streptomyces sp. HNM0575]|uniref:SRPBCC family protein n=1 Tax=Streptomyces sp. HNM0575 TaxID=2716338 RepID=UPI00145E5176|nr:SRPBCC family protein [Streptomyces sp. HNM0575]NLU73872.1 SRPBCC family protein [Streptomyces sp. HNM0575]